ncbi:hypothetical protein [Rhodobacter calidifons]|uniref:hypothetical protein n=1 Tax=Rhodobacter calidifons TaxID=2715277 RepID=UPI001F621B39|nr:hypothetical protein [Rhodobacter calidifons]
MSGQIHDSGEDAGLYLTVLCWIGLGLAALDAFVQPLPAGLVRAALALAYLTGACPRCEARWPISGGCGGWTSTS